MNRRNDRILTPSHPSGEGHPNSQGRALLTSIVEMEIFFKLDVLQIALVANWTCCKLHMLQIASVVNCTCVKLHVLQFACNSTCMCSKLFVENIYENFWNWLYNLSGKTGLIEHIKKDLIRYVESRKHSRRACGTRMGRLCKKNHN